MEHRVKIKSRYLFFLLSLAALLFSGKKVSAQETTNRFLFSVADYYSPKTMSNSSEIGVGYLFGKGGVKVNYGRIGLFDEKTANEVTVSVFQPCHTLNTLAIFPEVSAGILFGKKAFKDDDTVKCQMQAGVTLSYFISGTMACGISLKTLFYSEYVIPLIGWNYSIHF